MTVKLGTGSSAIDLSKVMIGGVAASKIMVGTGSSAVQAWAAGLQFTDTFNRANSSTLGAGWVQGGTGSGIGVTSNATSWGNGGGSDGNAWAIRDTDCNTGDQFVEVVVQSGGASSSRDSRLILHANTGLTSFAYLNWFSNALYLGRSNGSYTSITDMGSVTSGVTVSAASVIRFWNVGTVFKASVDGVEKLSVTDSGNTILRNSTTRRVGFGQERATFANSGWIDNFTGGDL